MLARSLSAPLAVLHLLVATVISASPSPLVAEEAQLEARSPEDGFTDAGRCKGRTAGTVGGAGTDYHSLATEIEGLKWTSGSENGQTARYSSLENKLYLRAGSSAKDNQLFVFKINNWNTRQQGVNYAYELGKMQYCSVALPRDHVFSTSTFNVKVQTI